MDQMGWIWWIVCAININSIKWFFVGVKRSPRLFHISSLYSAQYMCMFLYIYIWSKRVFMLIFQTIFHTIVLRLFCYSVLIVKAIQVENLGRNGKKQEIVQTQHHTKQFERLFPICFSFLGFQRYPKLFFYLCVSRRFSFVSSTQLAQQRRQD